MKTHWRRGLGLIFASLWLGSCYNFHLVGPEDPDPVSSPPLVSVMIEYRQPSLCANPGPACDSPVYFYGSWMRPGTSFPLVPDLGNHVWRGTAQAVPANYPPRDVAYDVWLDDPYLRDTPSRGVTADRLKVGGEALTQILQAGTDKAHALVFIDANGLGHNPL